MKVIILAGGLGTRLAGVLENCIKPMAPVQGRPFLAWLLDSFIQKGASEFILAVGHHAAAVQDYFGNSIGAHPIRYICEDPPRGTGSIVLAALALLHPNEAVLLCNGDTWIDFDLAAMRTFFLTLPEKSILLGLAQFAKNDRYGEVCCEGREVRAFLQKPSAQAALVYSGACIFKPNLLIESHFPSTHSFEYDIVTTLINRHSVYAYKNIVNFVDIGTPAAYATFQKKIL